MTQSGPVAWLIGPDRWMAPMAEHLRKQGWRVCQDGTSEGQVALTSYPPARSLASTDLDRRLEQVVAQHGRLDALVYAPAFTPSAALEQMTMARFRQSYQEPIKAAYVAAQVIGRYFATIPENEGLLRRIVFVGSIHGEKPSGSNLPWSLTASALAMLTKEAALALGRYGVAANLIAWGAEIGDDERLASPISVFYDHYRNKVPSGRLGSPQDLVETVAFLLNPSTHHLNGATLTMDGGLTLHYVDENMRLASEGPSGKERQREW